MAELGRSFDKLDIKIKELNTSLKSTDADLKKIDKDLKLNPGSVETVRKKFALLSQNLQTNTQKLAELKNKEVSLSEAFEKGEISQNSYNKQLQKVKAAAEAAEKQIGQLNDALRKQNAEIAQARFTGFIEGCDKVEAGAKKVSKAVLGVVAAVTTLFAASVSMGSELDDTAKKYDTTAERLQIIGNRFAFVTGNEDAYLQALTKVGSMQSSIAAGRGARYLGYLKQLGMTQDDLKNRTNAEIYDAIFSSLQKVTDETQRAIIAQGLFGDVGLDVATLAGTAAEEIRKWDEVLIENGIITNEQAAIAGEAGDGIDALKLQFQSTSMEVMVSLMPTFESFCDFLKETVIPTINRVSDWFKNLTPEQQKMLFWLLMILLVLPKLIGFTKGVATAIMLCVPATRAQTLAQIGLSAAMLKWTMIATLALAIIGLITFSLMNMKNETDGATSSFDEMMKEYEELEKKLKEMESETAYNAEATYESNSNRDLNIHVGVEASGDGTRINQQNAEAVAGSIHDKIIRDIVNQELGGVIR